MLWLHIDCNPLHWRTFQDTVGYSVVVLFDASPDWGWVCSETRTAGPIHLWDCRSTVGQLESWLSPLWLDIGLMDPWTSTIFWGSAKAFLVFRTSFFWRCHWYMCLNIIIWWFWCYTDMFRIVYTCSDKFSQFLTYLWGATMGKPFHRRGAH